MTFVSSRLTAAVAVVIVLTASACSYGPDASSGPYASTSAGLPDPSPCVVPANWSVPEQVGALWRCELAAAGVPASEAARLAADAVTLSHCESSWNASALAYAGRFRSTPHPVTGRTHSEAGVFQLSAVDVELFVPGGAPAALDSQANIVGAARLFLSRYLTGGRLAGFSPWPCATRVLPGFPDGPDTLPAWAWRY
jgi:hypothetical protein